MNISGITYGLVLACSMTCLNVLARDLGTIDETVTFLYYDDLESVDRFYGDILQLEKTMDEEWVKIYRITSTSSVGLVKSGRGAHEASEDKPVMLSLVTDDVDAWFEHLVGAQVPILKALPLAEARRPSGSAPVRAFLVEDPGGYTVEMFQWIRE